MKIILIINILIFCLCSTTPLPVTPKVYAFKLTQKQLDSLQGRIPGWSGDIPAEWLDYYPRPIWRLWHYLYGTGYYKDSDSTMVAYGDIIINPAISGWIKDDGTKSTNFTDNSDGIREDGIPYWTDSLRIYDYNNDKAYVSSSWVYAMPFWAPNLWPSYVKWREKHASWTNQWGFWPENPDHIKGYVPRLDNDEYLFNPGDSVYILSPLPNYVWRFWFEHKDEERYRNNINEEFDFFRKTPQIHCDTLGYGVIEKLLKTDRTIKYYKVKDGNVHVIEELVRYKEKPPTNWSY